MNKGLSDDKLKKIQELLYEGLSVISIACKTVTAQSTIRKYIKMGTLEAPNLKRKRSTVTQEEVEKIQDMMNNNLSKEEIAREIKVSLNTLNRLIREERIYCPKYRAKCNRKNKTKEKIFKEISKYEEFHKKKQKILKKLKKKEVGLLFKKNGKWEFIWTIKRVED